MSETDSTTHAYCPQCDAEYDRDLEHCPEDGTRLCSYNVPDGEEADEMIGLTLHERFEIESLLGEGGMGKVYLGRQLSVDREVAIKVLQPNLVNDDEAIKRFFREARVISGLNHPNIVQLYEFGQEPTTGVLYYVMEKVDGRELSDFLGRGKDHRLAPPLALEIAHQTCRGLAEPHAEGIIHRDLKPDNLMLVPMADGRFQVKVLDFGLARTLQTDTGLTSTGMVCGTAHYMSPQQAEGGALGPETDIYALGVVLFEMLTGQYMFGGDTPVQIMLKHVKNQPPELHELPIARELPDGLAELVGEMVEKAPEDRPQDVLEVQNRIDEIRRRHDYPTITIESDVSLTDSLSDWVRDSVEIEATETDSPPPAGSSEEEIDPLAATGAVPSPAEARPSVAAESQQDAPESAPEGEKPRTAETADVDLSGGPGSRSRDDGGGFGSFAMGVGVAVAAVGLLAAGFLLARNYDGSSSDPGAEERATAKNVGTESKTGASADQTNEKSATPKPSEPTEGKAAGTDSTETEESPPAESESPAGESESAPAKAEHEKADSDHEGVDEQPEESPSGEETTRTASEESTDEAPEPSKPAASDPEKVAESPSPKPDDRAGADEPTDEKSPAKSETDSTEKQANREADQESEGDESDKKNKEKGGEDLNVFAVD